MAQYIWGAGARCPVSAQVAGEVCEGLADHGGLTPQALVDASRDEDAPLHAAFEWEDAKAAELYRETQARYIIRSLDVVREGAEPVRGFVTLERTADAHEYHPIGVVLKSADDAASLLDQALRELQAFQRKYSQVRELAGVFDAIERAQA